MKTLENVEGDQRTGETILHSFTLLIHCIENESKPLFIVQMQEDSVYWLLQFTPAECGDEPAQGQCEVLGLKAMIVSIVASHFTHLAIPFYSLE